MITNFELITSELNDDEKKLVPILIKGFVSHKSSNPIKAPEIIKAINNGKYVSSVFSEARLRKISNFIRSEGIIPLIATSKGYYVSYDKNEIEAQIKSLNERAESIIHSANGLKKFLDK